MTGAGASPEALSALSVQSGAPLKTDPHLVGRAMTVGGFLHEVSTRDPDHEAVVCEAERVTYRELFERSRRVARALSGAGVGAGSTVAVMLPNGPDWISAFFGTTMLGAIVAAINTFAPDDEVAAMLAASDSKVLLTDRATLPHIGPSAQEGRRLMFVPQPGEVDDATEIPAETIEPADPAIVMFTSGSTGTPKLVLHTHESFCIQSWRWGVLEGHRSTDRVYTTAPFFWSSGLVRSMGGPLAAGATLVLQPRFEPLEALELLQGERVTSMLSRPHLDLRMLEHPAFDDHDLSAIRMLYEQSPLRLRLLGEEPTPKVGAYGMTETMTIVSYRRTTSESEDPAHGEILPGNTVRVADPDSGETLPLGETGRIWVRGPTVMRGYRNRDRRESFDDDGFFATSDAGFLDADGRIHWTGRLDNVIKVAGVKVSPTAVERQLAGWDSLVAYSVFAVPHPTLGAALVLAAAPRHGSGGEMPVDDVGIRSYLRGRLASYEQPRQIVIVDPDDVPFTSTLKVNVKGLQALGFDRLLECVDRDWRMHLVALQAAGTLPTVEAPDVR